MAQPPPLNPINKVFMQWYPWERLEQTLEDSVSQGGLYKGVVA